MSKHGITTQFGHKAVKAELNGYDQTLYRFEFPNGYGASVFREPHTESNLHELAVLKDGELTFTSPITDDVIRFATVEEISKLITKISNL